MDASIFKPRTRVIRPYRFSGTSVTSGSIVLPCPGWIRFVILSATHDNQTNTYVGSELTLDTTLNGNAGKTNNCVAHTVWRCPAAGLGTGNTEVTGPINFRITDQTTLYLHVQVAGGTGFANAIVFFEPDPPVAIGEDVPETFFPQVSSHPLRPPI